MDKERLEHGRAVIRGELGGARPHASLAAFIAAMGVCYGVANNPDAYSDDMTLAIADLDSELERAATDRNRLASAVAANTAASNRAESLQVRNDRQAETIESFDAQLRRLLPLSNELDECRESLKGMACNRDEWQAEARQQEIRADNADRQRNAAIDRADKLAAQLARLMKELGGLTLGQLPNGAYGGALADAYCDIKAGR